MTLGNRIKELRFSKNMTIAQLASKLNVSAVSVSRWEGGSRFPSRMNLSFLAKEFDVTIDYLLGEDFEMALRSLLFSYRSSDLEPRSRKLLETIELLLNLGGKDFLEAFRKIKSLREAEIREYHLIDEMAPGGTGYDSLLEDDQEKDE